MLDFVIGYFVGASLMFILMLFITAGDDKDE